MRTVKLLIEYDGTNYVGWQRQLNGVSIQGSIEGVLREILQEEVSIVGAGRTDTGVHARGQVAHFRTNSSLSTQKIQTALSGLLEKDIVIHNVSEVENTFHSRYDAKSRQYSYTISNNPKSIGRQYCWIIRYKLDVDLLNQYANLILGEHDFEGFAKVGSDVDHHRCTVLYSEWVIKDSILTYNIIANRFLRGMVRALVGAMIDIARGVVSGETFLIRLNTKQKLEPTMLAPANGLVLERIEY